MPVSAEPLTAVAGRLQAERDELVKQGESTSTARAPVELEQSSVGRLSRMDAIQVQAMALAAQQRRLEAIARIDRALARIADGSYGECTACGEPIAAKRLELDPAIPTCIACARG